jgi:hypothetical protein
VLLLYDLDIRQRPALIEVGFGGRSQLASLTAEIFQVPLSMDGGLSFGQYSRRISMNLSFRAGNQFCSLSLPGDSFWM